MVGTADVATVNLGVDVAMAGLPTSLRPGIGLRPGGERPELEPFVQAAYRALFDSIAAHARHGLDVVADLGIHDDHSTPLGIWRDGALRLTGVPTYVVGVHCTLDVVLRRRAEHPERYEVPDDGDVPIAAMRWEQAVHDPGWYDAEVDTSTLGPDACATTIRAAIATTEPQALLRHI